MSACEQDIGCIQKGPLHIDVEGTRAAYERFHRNWQDHVTQEADAIRRHSPSVLLSDISYLAIEAGARHFTHLFNAMPPLHHREPGAIGAALADDRCTVELIADGVHLHHAMLHVVGAQLHDRALLVTDAMRACGMPDGTYSLYQHQVTVRDGEARLADGALAGSVLTMGQALRNMVELAALPIETALPLATTIPARLLGVGDSKGRIATGYDADLVVLSPRLEIERVIVRGHEVRPRNS